MNVPILKSLFGAAIRFALLASWIFLLSHKLGPVPPLGKFFSPFEGFWRNAEMVSPHSKEVRVPKLAGNVAMEYDQRGVPHVFAQNLYGMFYAQGYATARDRLWQMDIQSRAGLGRLSEIMGSDLLRFDLERRRMGMAASAKTSLAMVCRDSISNLALDAYSAGVNAWIASLSPATYPLEFKLLDYTPEAWTPLKSMALLKNMQWNLSKSSDDYILTRTLEKFGAEFFAELCPLRNPGSEPIFPSSVFKSVGAVLTPPAGVGGKPPQQLQPNTDSIFPRPQPGASSSNFVLAGSRTASGHPILGNDPHLDLSLPSIWYESQLQGGNINAYGVSVPGLPGLVIGFNQRMAWGLTNGMDDVYDWYKIRFQNDSLNAYFWNGQWLKTRFVIDTITARGGKVVIDTQIWTHLGPVPVKNGERPFDRNTPTLHALRWAALDSSDDLSPFLHLLPAQGYKDFLSAIRGMSCPAQNFAFADSSGIALVHQGHIPIKSFGQGLTLVRENDSASEWGSYIPDSLLPTAYNPSQGWLASANQEPMDSAYPFYLGSGFYPSERAGRLNRLMESAHHATLDSAWNVVMNDQSLHAEQTLPLLLGCMDSTSSSSETHQALNLLQDWNYRYQAESTAPALFDLWWKNFYRQTWEDDFEGDTLHYAWPSRPVTRLLLQSDTASDWFDDIRTPKRESGCDLVRHSFGEAVQQSLKAGSGKFATWNNFHPLSIPHLLRLPALSRANLSGNGSAECLNAQRGSHGPSWRMVVEMNSTPLALGGYPGGQSGNPGSPNYDAFVNDWLAGRPYKLLFLQHPKEQPDAIHYSLQLEGTP